MVTTLSASAVGTELCKNPIVRKVSFTGSTAVGKRLMADCAETVKRLSLELGGNAPFIVFDDADLDAAVAVAITYKFRNAGQTCVCSNRILVQDGIYDAFARQFATVVQELSIGSGVPEGIVLGPLIDAARKSVVQGKSVSVRVDLSGCRIIKKKKVPTIDERSL